MTQLVDEKLYYCEVTKEQEVSFNIVKYRESIYNIQMKDIIAKAQDPDKTTYCFLYNHFGSCYQNALFKVNLIIKYLLVMFIVLWFWPKQHYTSR